MNIVTNSNSSQPLSAASTTPAAHTAGLARVLATILRAAGVYNLLWGALAVLAPTAIFTWLGMAAPNYPWLWQCIGMIVGVYGVGYLIAANDPNRHWPIILVGLLGKIFGPIGFFQTAFAGDIPWKFGLLIITNDLIWWAPFAMLLARAYRAAEHTRCRTFDELSDQSARAVSHAAAAALDQNGQSLDALSRQAPHLVVFLRHLGCTFCREALADLSAHRTEIESRGTRIAIVHMSPDAAASQFFAKYNLADVSRISDPDRALYNAFELRRGTLGQLFGWRSFLRGFSAGVLNGHGVGTLMGDGFQMPGAFIVRNGAIVRAFRHRAASDRPDYCELAAPMAANT